MFVEDKQTRVLHLGWDFILKIVPPSPFGKDVIPATAPQSYILFFHPTVSAPIIVTVD